MLCACKAPKRKMPTPGFLWIASGPDPAFGRCWQAVNRRVSHCESGKRSCYSVTKTIFHVLEGTGCENRVSVLRTLWIAKFKIGTQGDLWKIFFLSQHRSLVLGWVFLLFWGVFAKKPVSGPKCSYSVFFLEQIKFDLKQASHTKEGA